MANLPEDRLIPDQTPFTNLGVYFFGPFEVKCERTSNMVLFSPASPCEHHLQVAPSLDKDSCINAIRRFRSRRGQVKVLRCRKRTVQSHGKSESDQNTRHHDSTRHQVPQQPHTKVACPKDKSVLREKS